MDRILSEFTTRTSTDPGFARDLLEGHKWDLQLALEAYYVMKGLVVPECNGNISSDEIDSSSSSNEFKLMPIKCSEKRIRPNSYIKDINIDEHKVFDINRIKLKEDDSCQHHIVSIKCNSEPSLSSPSSISPCSNDSSTNSSPSKLAISKSTDDSPDLLVDVCSKKLSRGISRATDNVNLVTKARNVFAQDFRTSSRGSRLLNTNNLLEAPDFTFTLPDLSIHPEDFRQFLEQDLIEKSTLLSLESAGRLNWWSELGACQKLWPLATTGDGNCLLHAASLGMWGFHDRLLTLRKALHAILANSSYTNAFYRRWRWQTSLQNKEAGLVFSEDEWNREWECLLRMASSEPRVRAQYDKTCDTGGGKKSDHFEDETQPHVYESLEEIHIFALAHVLHRPIIVIADTMLKDITGEAFFPIPFGGIYLPLECPSSVSLMKSPLCLTYDAAHFSALVAMDTETYVDKIPHPPAAIPLTDSDHNILPLQFVVDPGENVDWNNGLPSEELIKRLTLSEKDKLNLLSEYFNLTFIKIPPSKTDLMIERDCVDRLNNLGVMEKSRTLPCSFESDDSSDAATCASVQSVGANTNNKSSRLFSTKTAKQIFMITKHFGSLGRMSKRIKKNLGTLARRTSFRNKNRNNTLKRFNNKPESKTEKPINYSPEKKDLNPIYNHHDSIIAAVLHTEKRHEYHDEMIRNYLNTARARFLRQQREKKSLEKQKESPESISSSNSTSNASTVSMSINNNNNFTNHQYNGWKEVSQCVNTGCKSFGSVETSYLCSSCYADQKNEFVKNGTSCDNSSSNKNIKSTFYNSDSTVKTTNKENGDIITCANSHFYVSTSS